MKNSVKHHIKYALRPRVLGPEEEASEPPRDGKGPGDVGGVSATVRVCFTSFPIFIGNFIEV